jgi:ABC-type transport system substrate-binding protein
MPRRDSAKLLSELCVSSMPPTLHLFFLFWPEKRKALCSEVQRIVADDLPYLPLWFTDVVSVHRHSLGDLPLSPTGDFDFLAALSSVR